METAPMPRSFRLLIGLASFVGSSLNDFVRSLSVYQTRLKAKTVEYLVWLNRHGIELSSDIILAYFDPGVAMRLAANTLTRLSSALTNTVLILLTVVFILLEALVFHANWLLSSAIRVTLCVASKRFQGASTAIWRSSPFSAW